ncbi:DUF4983 domain-containing protein [Sphingobacterium sp. SGG-5]|uniref:LamG-like jellyroll fold domain-containing protein n=1 Tax=Sphingobacterium sp. SGG-5 TaxID=2710881 RepID=UPI0013EE0DFC|nr:LamG-like jellyroll fold domain-containing protein [Sphingobacterium sp. SGG-5]NGM62156.1 DUF4983 domain-containing protein [Sphingobacterium sp. SGG-5]
MKRLIMISKMKFFTTYGVVGLLMLTLASCNKDFAFRLNLDEKPDDGKVRPTEYKVAYIIVEGGVGTIVGQQARDIGAMPTLGQLATHAMVSWNGVSAENKQSLTSYADLLTGVEYDKHHVAGDGSGNNLADYPTLFTHIADNTDMRMAFISANAALGAVVQSNEVDTYAIEGSDADVVTKAVEELEREDAGLVVATFKEVDATGQASGYDSEDYIEALGNFDQQLKSITDAIYSRKNYPNERWLIIVTSTKGGQYTLPSGQDDGSVFSDTERNNFIVVNNSQFAFKLYERMETVDPAWISSAVKYTSNVGRAVINAENAAIYNIEKNKEYTIQMRIKVHSYGTYTQTVFSKHPDTGGGSPGWAFMIGREGASGKDWSSGSFRFKVGGTEIYATADIAKEVWYSVIARVWMDGATQKVTVFRDGVEYNTGDISGSSANGVSNEPLQLGYAKGYATDFTTQSHTIADVRIYDVAKSVADIQSSYCTTMSTPSTDSYHNNLIGYWPGYDGGAELKDRSGNNRHFDLTGTYSWTNFADRSATLCPTLPDNLERYVIRSVDAPRLIFSWLNFMNIDEFDLDSQIWNPTFTNP